MEKAKEKLNVNILKGKKGKCIKNGKKIGKEKIKNIKINNNYIKEKSFKNSEIKICKKSKKRFKNNKEKKKTKCKYP